MYGKKLWEPSPERITSSALSRFMKRINWELGTDFTDYKSFYHWSVENISIFWEKFWDEAGIITSVHWTEVVDNPGRMPGAQWFTGARFNFAENLLRYRDNRTALVFKGEGQDIIRFTYRELYNEVARCAAALRDLGIVSGDRVAGFIPNMPHAIIAMLAATSIGATWSSCSPDFGVKGVMDRFGQIEPRVLFTADGYFFKGKRFDSLGTVAEIANQLPGLERIVVIPYTTDEPDTGSLPGAVTYRDFCGEGKPPELFFEQLPFDHPLYIMYSSGTTGLPKCMVQSAGGILLHHLKELILHTDLSRDDTIFYFTTCGWMMWNWLTSSLATGATLVLFDGNPFYPGPEALWDLAEEAGVTVFGTSAGYLGALEKTGYKPGNGHDLGKIRTLMSTGSPLSVEGFKYVYSSIKEDIQLASISGGTDLNGCFALGNPLDPVYAGEIQCRGLAMKVEAFNENGEPVIDEKGELVCTAAFPSMPINFWDDPDGSKYHSAYFDVYPGIWRHGDYIEINDRGGVVIYGRSDATLNPGGVRIGTADIYRVVEQIDEIDDSIVIGQNWKDDVRVILFIKLFPGIDLNSDLESVIRKRIHVEASPRHVPAKIIAVPDIPYTLNMKKVELAVKKTVQGEPVLNKDALRNPGSLDYFRDIPELEI